MNSLQFLETIEFNNAELGDEIYFYMHEVLWMLSLHAVTCKVIDKYKIEVYGERFDLNGITIQSIVKIYNSNAITWSVRILNAS